MFLQDNKQKISEIASAVRFFFDILDIEAIKFSCRFVETRSFYSELFKKFSLAVAALNSVNPPAMEKDPNALVTSPQRENSSPCIPGLVSLAGCYPSENAAYNGA